MLTRRIGIERLTFVSSKPFDAVVSAMEQSIGQPDIAEIGTCRSIRSILNKPWVLQQTNAKLMRL